MCNNLDIQGKERCGLEGQGLNTGSESCEPARDINNKKSQRLNRLRENRILLTL